MSNVWNNVDGTDFPQSAKGVSVQGNITYSGDAGLTHPKAMVAADGTVSPTNDYGWTWQKHTAAAE